MIWSRIGSRETVLQGDALIYDQPHHRDLELLAAQALARNDYARAFELSDRRCRIAPAPQPNSYLLRAEASFRMRQEAYALADLDKALELAPDDVQANRRMLAWSEGERKTTAARSLLTNTREVEVLRKAIDTLQHQAPTKFASMAVLDESIEGWVAWDKNSAAEVSIVTQDNIVSFFIDPDPVHILSNDGRSAASFFLARPASIAPQSFFVSIDGYPIFSLRAPGNVNPARNLPRITSGGSELVPTVIIPVYADFSATRACLDSILKAMQSSTFKVLLVNDASPDSRIRNYLDAFAKQPGVEMLINSSNIGFVGSVNRALEAVRGGDVILLNSDTIVPPGFVDRLSAAAHSSTDIGTVVPLSNNGEFSSFPVGNDVNELGSYDDVVALDRIAASVNGAAPVDVPSGIGFCLYITRACLNAVGYLSEHYQRGYLEDVDLCLRARELGLRSVCAPSVYVGHEGSRSFKSEKRSLVVRNLQVLDGKFPNYRNECSAFVAVDPLRSAREAIERSIPFRTNRPNVIVVGTGAVRAIAQARGRALLAQEQQALLLEVTQDCRGPVVRPVGPDGRAPQNIRFAISDASEQAALDQYLTTIRPSRFEILDPVNVPSSLLNRIIQGETPYDIYIANSGLFYPAGQSPRVRKANQHDLQDTNSTESASSRIRLWQHQWQTVAEGAEHIFTPCAMANAFVARHLPTAHSSEIDEIRSPDRAPLRHRIQRLGILVFRTSTDEFGMIQNLARAFLDRHPHLKIVVIGSTIDDQKLMKGGNTHVTGTVPSDEIDRVIDQYDLDAFLIGSGSPLFGHPSERSAVASGLPIARFDWSDGRYHTQEPDLTIDPCSDLADISKSLLSWMERR